MLNYYPPVSNLINTEILSFDISIESTGNRVLDKVKYKKLVIYSSKEGDSKSYHIELLIKDVLNFDISGLHADPSFQPISNDVITKVKLAYDGASAKTAENVTDVMGSSIDGAKIASFLPQL